MKSVGLLLLVTLTVVHGAGKEPKNKEGRCPQLIDYMIGKECTNPCTSDGDCSGTEKCCLSDGGPNCFQCMEPQKETPETMCMIACQRIYLPVCGTDGVSYGNNCTLNFLTCTRNQGFIKFAYEGNCKDRKVIDPPRYESKCQVEGVETPCTKKLQEVQQVHLIGAPEPRCDDNGYYKPKQCSGSTGSCWCVDCLGNRLNDAVRVPLTDEDCEPLRNN